MGRAFPFLTPNAPSLITSRACVARFARDGGRERRDGLRGAAGARSRARMST